VNRVLGWRQRCADRHRRGEAGFTLIELSVALFCVLLVMAALAAVLIGSLRTVSQSRQRQTATALATSAMEQLRSLDYDTLKGGISCTGASTMYVSGTCPNLTLTLNGYNETVLANGNSATPPPLSPNVRNSAPIDGITYATYVWVTKNGDTAFNLTVLVTWVPNTGGGLKQVVQRSTAFSPTRCLSSATHPWSGPCQASFSGQAGVTNASITVTNATDSTQPIPGLGATSLALDLPGLSVSNNNEQVSKLSATGQTSDATLLSNGVTTVAGGVSSSAAADNDPASAATSLSSTDSKTQAYGTQSVTGAAGTLAGAPLYSDSNSVGSAVAATTTCVASNGTPMPSTGLPCSWGSQSSSGTTSGAGSLTYNPSGLPKTFPLATLPSTSAMSAVTSRVTSSNGVICPGTSGVGCQAAQASRSFGTLALGGLPAASTGDSLPSNWSVAGSMISLSGFSEAATAESGIRTTSPTAASYTRSGTVKYYNGNSTPGTINLNTLSANTTVTLPAASAIYKNGGHTFNVAITGSFTVNAYNAAGTSSGSSPCKSAACAANANPASVLTANLVYTVTYDGTVLTTFVVTADLGALLAQTSYLAAFDG
jgi:type II secretory pathway pseudopilin PulG